MILTITYVRAAAALAVAWLLFVWELDEEGLVPELGDARPLVAAEALLKETVLIRGDFKSSKALEATFGSEIVSESESSMSVLKLCWRREPHLTGSWSRVLSPPSAIWESLKNS